MKNSLLFAEYTGGRDSGDAVGDSPFSKVLEPGERVLWAGQPRPFRIMRSKAAHALFGTIVLVMLTMTPVRGSIDSPAQPPLPQNSMTRQTIGVIAVCIAGYSMFVPFVAYRRARKTWYAVTDRRVLRVRRGCLESSADLDEVEAASLRAVEDGTGDIMFSPILAYGQNGSPRFLRELVGVADADEVHRTILNAREERARGREQVVHDYLDFLIQGKRPEDL